MATDTLGAWSDHDLHSSLTATDMRAVAILVPWWALLVSNACAQSSRLQVGLLHAGTFDTGGLVSVVETTRLGSLEIDAAIRLVELGPVSLESSVGVIPIAWVRGTALGPASVASTRDRWLVPSEEGRTTSRGWGVRPLGLRGVVGSGALRLQAEAAAGVLRFDVPTPASNASRLNLTAEAAVGVRMEVPGAHLALGYRLHHLSNAGWWGTVNPGIDSHMVYLGFWMH